MHWVVSRRRRCREDYEQLQNAAQEAATDLIEQSVRETFGIEVPQVPDETSTSREGSVEQEADAVLPWIDRVLDEITTPSD